MISSISIPARLPLPQHLANAATNQRMACQATLASLVLPDHTRAVPSACRVSLPPSHRAAARARVSLAALERRARRTPPRASCVPWERTRTTTTYASNAPMARSRPQREPHRASNAARSCLNHAALDRRKECRVACVRLERMVHRPPVDASTVLRYVVRQSTCAHPLDLLHPHSSH